jgi:HAE1 family hydrophobic/amphiphilic exporter-1
MEYDELGTLANDIAAQMTTIEGLVDLDVSHKPGRPEYQIDVDRRRAADLRLSTAQIASTVRLLVNGDVATTFRGEGTDADIRVRLAESDRSSSEDVLKLRLLSSSGQLIPLRNVAQITTAAGPNAITRSDRRPSVTVAANVAGGRSVPSATQEVSELMTALDLPAGVEARLGGDAEAQEESFASLLAALALGVVFIYMVLASQFGSLLQPLIIMLAMPLAIVGAILALLLSGRPLDMTAMIGFMMLMGLVVKNSVLLVDFANRAHRRGVSAGDAMRTAGPVRLRPILMTSFAMILAMIPIALGLSAGGEFRQPMAIAILGGMITSTLLTLVIVPLAYATVVGLQDRLTARRAHRRLAHADASSGLNDDGAVAAAG